MRSYFDECQKNEIYILNVLVETHCITLWNVNELWLITMTDVEKECLAYKWASSWEYVSSGVSDQARHKPACAATEAS